MKEEEKEKNILLVTHGDICKAIYVYFNKNLTIEDIIAYEKENCEIIEYEV